MKWQTKNHIGKTVTWYSEDVIERIKEKLKQVIEKQDLALDVEETDMEESIDLLYEVSEELEEILDELEEE